MTDLARIRDNVAHDMLGILTNFEDGAKIAVLVRTPGHPERDFISTDDDIVELRAMLVREEERGRGWRPIATAPKDGTFIFLSLPFPFRPTVGAWQSFEGIAQWGADPETFAEEEHFLSYWRSTAYQPTHWRPLDAPVLT